VLQAAPMSALALPVEQVMWQTGEDWMLTELHELCLASTIDMQMMLDEIVI